MKDDEEVSKMTVLEEEGDPLVVPFIIEISKKCAPQFYYYY